MPPLSPASNLLTTMALVILPLTTTLASPLYDSSDSRKTALKMRGFTPTPLPLQTFLSPPVILSWTLVSLQKQSPKLDRCTTGPGPGVRELKCQQSSTLKSI